MYKLSQWAGDFPNALGATWELYASVHEPTRGTSHFQICVTAFAYISILSCFPVSYISPSHPRGSFIPHPPHLPSLFWTRAVQISRYCRCQLVLWQPSSNGPTDGWTDTRTGAQPLLVNQALRTIMIDRVRLQTDARRRGSDADEKSPPDNTLRFLRLSALSEAPCFSFSPFDSHLLWLTVIDLFSFCLFCFPRLTALETEISGAVHWQILYKIAIKLWLSKHVKNSMYKQVGFLYTFEIMVYKEWRERVL